MSEEKKGAETPTPPAKPIDVVRIWASLDQSLPRFVAEMTLPAWYSGAAIQRSSPLAWGEVPAIVLELHGALGEVLKHVDTTARLINEEKNP